MRLEKFITRMKNTVATGGTLKTNIGFHTFTFKEVLPTELNKLCNMEADGIICHVTNGKLNVFITNKEYYESSIERDSIANKEKLIEEELRSIYSRVTLINMCQTADPDGIWSDERSMRNEMQFVSREQAIEKLIEWKIDLEDIERLQNS